MCMLCKLLLMFINLIRFHSEFFLSGTRIYKVYSALGAYVSGGKYGSSDSIAKLSEVSFIFTNTMKEVLEESKWLLIPLIAGLGMTLITWYTIYFDSCIPGVRPPTPFSPNRSRFVSLNSKHIFNISSIKNETSHGINA